MDYELEVLKDGEHSIRMLDKLLWAFAMRDAGTSEFFAQVAYWIRLFDLENNILDNIYNIDAGGTKFTFNATSSFFNDKFF